MFKKEFYFIFLILLGCLAPRDHRLSKPDSDTYSGQFDGPTPEEMEDPATTNNGDEGPDIPEQFSHCKFSKDGSSGFEKSSGYIGPLTVCRSTEDEKSLYIQLKNTVRDLCFVPVSLNKDTGGTVYIGEPRCRNFESSKSIYPITLYKNRTGFSDFSIDGVMIMKNELDYYENPFNKYIRTPDAYIECSERLAQDENATYCEAFKKKNKYIYWQFSAS